MKSLQEQLNILSRNAVDILPDGGLEAKLKESIETGRPLRVKQGFDPTAPDIHLGHTVGLRKLREFQDLGHTVVVIVGDYTARVGDPSGKSATRPQLSGEDIEANAKTYLEQFFIVVDKSKTEIRRNSEWFEGMRFEDLLKFMSTFTLARMLERDDFDLRYKTGSSIALHELLYPIMQAYDSVAIKADIEIGGTDQLFNLLTGRQAQEARGMSPQVALTLPLIEGLDGENKMSKSLDNYIGITEPATEIFGKIMSIPDDLILKYFRFLTGASDIELEGIEAELEDPSVNPMSIKKRLGTELAAMYTSREEADLARQAFDKQFSKGEKPDEVPRYDYDLTGKSETYWPGVLVTCGMVSSTSAGRQLIDQGGLTVDGKRVTDYATALPFESENDTEAERTVKAGKRRWSDVRFYRTK
jgi:tyrosyl-tRNA synthetase